MTTTSHGVAARSSVACVVSLKAVERLSIVLLIGLCLQAAPNFLCRAQSSDDKVALDSFKNYAKRHLESYKSNRRERITYLGGGWVKEYFEADASSTQIDVQRTNSLITPYIGKLEFRMVRHLTAFHNSREDALADTTFLRTDATSHRHNYAYQDGQWVLKARQYSSAELRAALGDTWYDCTEVISAGPDAGETNIHGCMEEYDDDTKR